MDEVIFNMNLLFPKDSVHRMESRHSAWRWSSTSLIWFIYFYLFCSIVIKILLTKIIFKINLFLEFGAQVLLVEEVLSHDSTF